MQWTLLYMHAESEYPGDGFGQDWVSIYKICADWVSVVILIIICNRGACPRDQVKRCWSRCIHLVGFNPRWYHLPVRHRSSHWHSCVHPHLHLHWWSCQHCLLEEGWHNAQWWQHLQYHFSRDRCSIITLSFSFPSSMAAWAHNGDGIGKLLHSNLHCSVTCMSS